MRIQLSLLGFFVLFLGMFHFSYFSPIRARIRNHDPRRHSWDSEQIDTGCIQEIAQEGLGGGPWLCIRDSSRGGEAVLRVRRRRPEPHDPGRRHRDDQDRVRSREMCGGDHLREAFGGGTLLGSYGCIGGRMATWLGGRCRGERSLIRRFPIHRKALPDMVSECEAVADECGRSSL